MQKVTELEPDRLAASRARRLVDEAVESWGSMDADFREMLFVLVSELVTNAVVHGKGPPRLAVRLDGDDLWVGVTDEDPTVPEPTPPERGQVGGFGMWLLRELASGWGVAVEERTGHKTVWFTLPLRVDPGLRSGARTGVLVEAQS